MLDFVPSDNEIFAVGSSDVKFVRLIFANVELKAVEKDAIAAYK